MNVPAAGQLRTAYCHFQPEDVRSPPVTARVHVVQPVVVALKLSVLCSDLVPDVLVSGDSTTIQPDELEH